MVEAELLPEQLSQVMASLIGYSEPLLRHEVRVQTI